VLQIPAFLCRQTDLIVAAARTGRPVHVKKGPFLAPADMAHVAAKVSAAGTGGVLLCERGTSFGHGDLVVDMRGLPIMAATGHPVIFDATHSVQQPGAGAGGTGGRRGFVPALARAAVAIGVAGLFIESHDRPDAALSDAATQFPLDRMPALIADLAAFDALAKTRPRPFDPDGQDNAA